MLYGHVRDQMPRLLLTLPGQTGDFSVEFIINTGFNGELTLPPEFARRLEISRLSTQSIRVAGGTEQECSWGQIQLDWNDDLRLTEVLILDGNPLIGMRLLENCQVCFHVSDGGEVTVEEG